MEQLSRRAALPAVFAALALALSGCGGKDRPPSPSPAPSPSPSPPPPAPPPGPLECPDDLKRGHCNKCSWTGEEVVCLGCSGPYTLNEKASSPERYCTFDCGSFTPAEAPGKPGNAQALNGIEWPAVCIPEEHSRFLTIGDWGGLCGWGAGNKCLPGVVPAVCPGGTEFALPGVPCPMPNRASRIFVPEIEGKAQRLVSDRMLARAKELKAQNTPARFIINVGDNFYPGGIDEHCGLPDMSARSSQFEEVWKSMYSEELMEIQWWSVLGNHDYGGVCYIKGWDQQIYYTWHEDKWLLPAQYWRRSVQYSNFKADFFFIDSNVFDTTPGTDEEHNICSKTHNPGDKCELAAYPGSGSDCGATGPHNPADCTLWFKKLWEDTYSWLQEVLLQSEADWQIIVGHYPASYNLGYAPMSYMVWADFLTPMGVDLFIAGHTHEQKVFYGDFGEGKNMRDTAWVITGGGGGVTSEISPAKDGHDDAYGFMEVELSLKEMKITAYSHGGTKGQVIVRNQTTVRPVARKSLAELAAAGLLKPPQGERPAVPGLEAEALASAEAAESEVAVVV